LESYYPYLQPQEVSKAPTTSCTYNSLPKSAKSRFGCPKPLGNKTFFRDGGTFMLCGDKTIFFPLDL
jgi:hypothetical protein